MIEIPTKRKLELTASGSLKSFLPFILHHIEIDISSVFFFTTAASTECQSYSYEVILSFLQQNPDCFDVLISMGLYQKILETFISGSITAKVRATLIIQQLLQFHQIIPYPIVILKQLLEMLDLSECSNEVISSFIDVIKHLIIQSIESGLKDEIERCIANSSIDVILESLKSQEHSISFLADEFQYFISSCIEK